MLLDRRKLPIKMRNNGDKLLSILRDRKGKKNPNFVHGLSHDKIFHRDWHYKRIYGMQEGEFDRLRRKQNYRCAICRKRKKLSVDHDHNTNRVRGLLCTQCNVRLGVIENPVFMAAVRWYLEH
jgi:DNA-directed RNA polymerase subunit RPC12/RpoP